MLNKNSEVQKLLRHIHNTESGVKILKIICESENVSVQQNVFLAPITEIVFLDEILVVLAGWIYEPHIMQSSLFSKEQTMAFMLMLSMDASSLLPLAAFPLVPLTPFATALPAFTLLLSTVN
jgi:hypothetical protein